MKNKYSDVEIVDTFTSYEITYTLYSDDTVRIYSELLDKSQYTDLRTFVKVTTEEVIKFTDTLRHVNDVWLKNI